MRPATNAITSILVAFLLTAAPRILAGQAVASSSATLSACADRDAVRRTVDSAIGRQQNVGVSIAIMRGGRLVGSFGFGYADLEDSTLVTPRSRFPLASITKAFTGVALLRAAERGDVDLDAPIQRYVAGFPRKPGGDITLRLLAAHLAGIRHWGAERSPALYARHFDDVREIVPLFANDTLVAPPNTRYSYSSYGYNLIAAALQAATGVRFQELVRRDVLRPLGLHATDFTDVRAIVPYRVRNYSFYDLTTFADLDTPVRVPEWDYSHNMAGGNMISTAEELVRFGDAMTRPGLLSVQSLSALSSPPKGAKAESSMSFGWFFSSPGDRAKRISIGGSNAGVQTALYVYPETRLVIAMLSNSWGKGSRSGDFNGGGPNQLPSRLAALCAP
jgi:CubicO group peptidase (beta-lactamase class C family)